MDYIKLSGGDVMDYIKLIDCRDKYLYKIYARNFSYGVFSNDSSGFIGIRNKFEEVYLFMEYHWDCGVPLGTVKPIKKLFRLPNDLIINEGNKELFDWLIDFLRSIGK